MFEAAGVGITGDIAMIQNRNYIWSVGRTGHPALEKCLQDLTILARLKLAIWIRDSEVPTDHRTNHPRGKTFNSLEKAFRYFQTTNLLYQV